MGINIIEQNNGNQVYAYRVPDFIDKKKEDIGSKEEDFEILMKIGEGSFSKVFKVKSKKNFGIYAMKKVDLIDNNEINDVKKEAKILPKLDHPNIVKCYGTFTDDTGRYLYFIMELLNNGDLEGFKDANEGLHKHAEEKILWKIFYDCLKGLVYIHKQELIHRDIKSKNLFFDEKLKIKIGDFNVSVALNANAAKRFAESNQEKDYNNYIADVLKIGTEDYQAPEINGFDDYNEKVDVYSMGVTFFELCYYKCPKKVDKDYYLNQDIYSKELNDLIRGMLLLDPYERLSSYEAVAIAKKYYIQKFLKNTSVEAVLRCLYEFPNFHKFFEDLDEKSLDPKRELEKGIYKVFKSFKENIKDKIDDNLYELRRIMDKFGLKTQRKDIEIDPSMLIIKLLSRLNSELNEIEKQPENITNLEYRKSSKNYRFETGEEENFFKELLGIYNKRILSFISKNFFNFIITDLRCEKCNDVGHSFSQTLIIPFNVQILAKKMGNNDLNIKTGFDCLLQDFMKIRPKNVNQCKNCKENSKELVKTMKFYHTAKNLIIILDRGKDYKIDIPIDFDETLQLKKGDIQRFNEINYKLVGIIEKVEDKFMPFTKNNTSWVSSEGIESTFDEIKNVGNVIALFYYSENDDLILKSEPVPNTVNPQNNQVNNNIIAKASTFTKENIPMVQNFVNNGNFNNMNNVNNNVNNSIYNNEVNNFNRQSTFNINNGNNFNYNPNAQGFTNQNFNNNMTNQMNNNINNNAFFIPNNQNSQINPNNNQMNMNNNFAFAYTNNFPNNFNNNIQMQQQINNNIQMQPQINNNIQMQPQPIQKQNNMINSAPTILLSTQQPNTINMQNLNNPNNMMFQNVNGVNMVNMMGMNFNNNMGMNMMGNQNMMPFQGGYMANGQFIQNNNGTVQQGNFM